MDVALLVLVVLALIVLALIVRHRKRMSDTATALSMLLAEVENDVQARITSAVDTEMGSVRDQLAELRETARTGTEHLTVTVGEDTHHVEGVRHKQLTDLLTVAAQGLPALLVGMAGSGKTHAAEQVAEALGRPFYAMSVGAQTSKSDIIGYMHAGGDYVPTLFRKAYEDGGVFLMDEIDAGNANVLIQVNAALSNNYCAFPDGMVKRHDDFVFVASANTFGNGANRQYVGRNQLDAATLDRFTIINWGIDDALEKTLAGTGDKGALWYRAVCKAREKVEKDGLRVLVTPRATLRGARLLAAGVATEAVAEQALLNLFPEDKRNDFKYLVLNVMNGRGDATKTTSDEEKKEKKAEVQPVQHNVRVDPTGRVAIDAINHYVTAPMDPWKLRDQRTGWLS